MRIVFMAYDRPNYNAGPIINAIRLLPEFVRRGHDVYAFIAYINGGAPHADLLKKQGVKCELIPFPKYSENFIVWILQQVNNIQPDIFVANISVQGGYAGKWIRKSGVPTIITHRSDDALNWELAKEFYIRKNEWSASGLVCVSEYLKSEVLKSCNRPDEIKVIPSGVPIPTQVALHEGEELKIVYAGRLVQKQKRVQDLLEALIPLLLSDQKIKMTFIGEGHEKESLQAKVKVEGLSAQVKFTGQLAGKKYQDELLKNHIIVLMSDYEGMPGSIMDGMACGLVPVCIKIKGIEELVQHRVTGFLFDSRDEFIEAIQDLRNIRLRKLLSSNARHHIVQHYSLKATTDSWEAFFLELIQKSGKKSKISIPFKLNLPAVHSAFAQEDRRKPSFWQEIKDKVQLRTRVKNTISCLKKINL